MGRDRRGQDDVPFAPSSRSWGRERVCVPLFFVFYSPLLLFSSSNRSYYYSIISFFVIINNRQFEVGPDRTDEADDVVDNRNARWTRRGETQQVRVVLFFVLYSINFFFSLFFFSNYLQYDNIRGGAGRNGTDAGGAATWDETGGRRAGRGGRRTGGGGERGRAGS